MANSIITKELTYRQQWHLKNRERVLAVNREWAKRHPENQKERHHRYYLSHKEQIYEAHKRFIADHPKYRKEYYWENHEKCLAYRKKHYKNNKKKCNDISVLSHARQYKTNPAHKIHQCFSSRILRALKTRGIKKVAKLETMLGYSIAELEVTFKKTMPSGYTWNDYLSGKLHVDHILPVAAFNFKSAEDIDFKRCWALSNLQLLPATENLKKGAKILYPFHPTFSMVMNQ